MDQNSKRVTIRSAMINMVSPMIAQLIRYFSINATGTQQIRQREPNNGAFKKKREPNNRFDV